MAKLIRDKIPEKILASGMVPRIRVERDDSAFNNQLKDKLQEEVTEFLSSDSLEELADVLEVIDAIIAFREIDRDKLAEVRREKADRVGIFQGRIILEGVSKTLDPEQ